MRTMNARAGPQASGNIVETNGTYYQASGNTANGINHRNHGTKAIGAFGEG